MKKIVYLLLPVGVVFLMIILTILLASPYGPRYYTREDVLRVTPIGTSMEDTIRLIRRSNRIGIHHIDHEHGFAISGNGSWNFTDDEEIVGVASIRGYFRIIVRDFPFDRSRSSSEHIFWGFDENGKLVDVYIWPPNEL